MLAVIPGASYVARVSLHDIPHQRRARLAIQRVFQVQLLGRGFSLVEILAICPTNWVMSPPAVPPVAGKEHDPLLPAGGVQGTGKARTPPRRGNADREAGGRGG